MRLFRHRPRSGRHERPEPVRAHRGRTRLRPAVHRAPEARDAPALRGRRVRDAHRRCAPEGCGDQEGADEAAEEGSGPAPAGDGQRADGERGQQRGGGRGGVQHSDARGGQGGAGGEGVHATGRRPHRGARRHPQKVPTRQALRDGRSRVRVEDAIRARGDSRGARQP